MELQPALHASRIETSIIEEHYITINEFSMWRDSSTVIQWLNAFAKRQQIFCCESCWGSLQNNKLGEWNHIPSAQHPAGHGTRGKKTG